MSDPQVTHTLLQRWPEEVALLELWLDGDATQDEFEKLDSALSASAELAMYAAQRLTEHRLLGVLHQSENDAGQCSAIMERISGQQSAEVDKILNVVQAASLPVKTPSASGRFPVQLMAMLAACAATVLIAGVLFWNSKAVSPPTAAQSAEVATMLLVDECRWQDGQIIAEGQRLGGRLKLLRGLAVLRFDGGAELILRSDSELELLSPGEALLHRGDVVVNHARILCSRRCQLRGSMPSGCTYTRFAGFLSLSPM